MGSLSSLEMRKRSGPVRKPWIFRVVKSTMNSRAHWGPKSGRIPTPLILIFATFAIPYVPPMGVLGFLRMSRSLLVRLLAITRPLCAAQPGIRQRFSGKHGFFNLQVNGFEQTRVSGNFVTGAQ